MGQWDRVYKECRHCKRPKVNRPRGLCYTCWWNPAIRERYPSTSKFARRSTIGDGNRAHRLPETPTDAEPGSELKLQVMERRAALGVSLHHPLDALVSACVPPRPRLVVVNGSKVCEAIQEETRATG